MKIVFYENNYESRFTLLPETPEETAQILRMTINSSAEPANIYTCIRDNDIRTEVSIRKINIQKQNLSISRKNRR